MKQKTLLLIATLFVTLVCAAPGQARAPRATHTQSSGSACQGTRYIGSLSFTGDFDYQPNGSYYHSSSLGFHKGCLVGPSSGADFDLYLQKWNGTAWVIVASSQSETSNETTSSFNGPGYYRWQIYSYSG